MTDGPTRIEEPKQTKEQTSRADFDVPSRDAPPFREEDEDVDLNDKLQEDLSVDDLRGDARQQRK